MDYHDVTVRYRLETGVPDADGTAPDPGDLPSGA
ncbi:hypothetical protein SUDANB146_06184 [Streptomyces sp. enrichment culture]